MITLFLIFFRVRVGLDVKKMYAIAYLLPSVFPSLAHSPPPPHSLSLSLSLNLSLSQSLSLSISLSLSLNLSLSLFLPPSLPPSLPPPPHLLYPCQQLGHPLREAAEVVPHDEAVEGQVLEDEDLVQVVVCCTGKKECILCFCFCFMFLFVCLFGVFLFVIC